MTMSKKRLLEIVSGKSATVKNTVIDIQRRALLRESQYIAFKVLEKLDELGWTQRRLSVELCVSPQQVSKIVSGKENLTIETLVKLQEILDVPLLASYYDAASSKLVAKRKRIKDE